MRVLGLSCHTHDSAVALISDGVIQFAQEEEKLSRIKHDSAFPALTLNHLQKTQNLNLDSLDYIAFFEKPWSKLERMLHFWLAAPKASIQSFLDNVPPWLSRRRIPPARAIADLIATCTGWNQAQIMSKLWFSGHHLSHAASAYFTSPFSDSAVLCVDGTGEWTCSSIWKGEGNTLNALKTQNFPHSIGLFYAMFTGHLGFKIHSGEYKVMGLAAYGEPRFEQVLRDEVIQVDADGGVTLNLNQIDFLHACSPVTESLQSMIGIRPRTAKEEVSKTHMDLARSVQTILEDCLMKMTAHALKQAGSRNLCLSGGVALNCVANGKIQRSGLCDQLHIQPACGDAGGALGAALAAISHFGHSARVSVGTAALGTKIDSKVSKCELEAVGLTYHTLSPETQISTLAQLLAQNKVVGVARGRCEFGPRSLGFRSILAHPGSQSMRDRINEHIKQREPFRPFAPIVCLEEQQIHFDLGVSSPYMLLTAPVLSDQIPAVTHVDGSARLQSVNKSDQPWLHELLKEFSRQSGAPPVLLNTSFNLRGEPIPATEADCIRSFLFCRLDAMLLANHLVLRDEQTESCLNSIRPDEIVAD